MGEGDWILRHASFRMSAIDGSHTIESCGSGRCSAIALFALLYSRNEEAGLGGMDMW